MRVDPSFTLRQGEHLVATRAPHLPHKEIAKALRIATQFRVERIQDDALPVGASRLGGRPDLPPSIEWPRWNGFAAEDFIGANGARFPRGCKPATLSFVAQLNLAEIPDGTGLLPDKGWLFFFYDVDQQPWGFDPRHRGCSRVFYFDGGVDSLRRNETPPDLMQFELAATKLTPSLTATLPRWHYQLGLDLDESARRAYWKLAESEIAGSEPHHRLLGWPKQVQGEMNLECQLVTNGIYCGGPDAYESEEARRLKAGASDWIMLLQLDTDEQGPGWMWGDDGCLYFWIRKADLASRRFENVWTILQCY
jgi:uncharacterized protein YwqG